MTHKIRCPFCLNHIEDAKPGKTTCSECSAEFEIDDRLECIFADISKMRFSVKVFVCMVCWLVEGDQNWRCVYCGAKLNSALQ